MIASNPEGLKHCPSAASHKGQSSLHLQALTVAQMVILDNDYSHMWPCAWASGDPKGNPHASCLMGKTLRTQITPFWTQTAWASVPALPFCAQIACLCASVSHMQNEDDSRIYLKGLPQE